IFHGSVCTTSTTARDPSRPAGRAHHDDPEPARAPNAALKGFRPKTTNSHYAFPGPSRDGRHGNVRTPLGKRVQKQLWRRSRALTPPAGGNERGRTGGSINPATDDTPPMPPVPAPSGPVSGFVTGAPI